MILPTQVTESGDLLRPGLHHVDGLEENVVEVLDGLFLGLAVNSAGIPKLERNKKAMFIFCEMYYSLYI